MWQAQAGNAEAQYQAGRFYVRRGDWAKAVPWYEKSAAQGNGKAQNNLGVAYMQGTGVKADKEKGCRLLAQAYEKLGTRHGLENLAMCRDALGEYGQAFADYLAAARQGSVQSMRAAAQMYQQGEGTAQNDEMAFYWFRQAALKNDARAMYSLGLMYGKRQGVADYGSSNGWAAYILMKAAETHRTGDDAKMFEDETL